MLLQPERAARAEQSWAELALREVGSPAAFAGLSPAELMVALQLAQGCSNREIATALGKSEATVKHQVSACLRKLGVPSRARLIALLR